MAETNCDHLLVAEVTRHLGVAASTLYRHLARARTAADGPGRLSRNPPMPIKPELRWFYPIDWPQVSHWVRFVRAKGRCQACGRPHGKIVRHLGDGRWWDEQRQVWRDGRGRKVPSPALAKDVPVRTTKVVLAAAHLDHDPTHCGRKHRNVRALCQRCQLLHDRLEHRRRIRLTLRWRRALGDLFAGPYPGN